MNEKIKSIQVAQAINYKLQSRSYNDIATKLDLNDFIKDFSEFFARAKSIDLEGDKNIVLGFITELEKIQFTSPPQTQSLDDAILKLKKFGVLGITEIFEFVKIIRYFLYLKSLNSIVEGMKLHSYLKNIQVPQALFDLLNIFEEHNQIKQGIYEELDSLLITRSRFKTQVSKTLDISLQNQKLAPYLVDRQIHYINDNETLLLKAGFTHIIKGIIISRSQSGFFYLLPKEVHNLYQRIAELDTAIQTHLYKICKNISNMLNKHILFLNFINKEFDQFDHLQARVNFAKMRNLEFITNFSSDKSIVLKDFCHPALNSPKPLSIDFSSSLLMITGVNAGGKTMLLKSILTSVFLAKYFLPMKINAHYSKIASFKNIKAIIADPQNSKNDISTFAGRMLEFSQILNIQELIIGIDEIELGTDADEASSLYKTLLEHLLDKNAKIIITTHHKRLASLMASDKRISMCAAIFDEQKQEPTYEFLHGSVGKSYAFETAKRYGIPPNLIEKAYQAYGKEKEKLNYIIEKSIHLENELRQKSSQLDYQIKQYEQKKQESLELIEKLNSEYTKEKSHLQAFYTQALNELKEVAKNKEISNIHRGLNNANKIVANIKKQNEILACASKSDRKIKIGDKIKYGTQKGIVIGKNGGKNETYFIELDSGIKLKTAAHQLKIIINPSEQTIKKAKTELTYKNNKASVNLDLRGLRSEEAVEKLDAFLSDSLIAGFDEVLVYHGIGSGRLAAALKEFLSSHPKVISFVDAPPQMGGLGAKLIKL